MLFEKEKYYKYINDLQKNINVIYVIYGILGVIIGIAIQRNIIGPIIGLVIGIVIAGNQTLKTKIKIQEMKWKMDIYERIK